MTQEKPLSIGETLEQMLRKEGLNQTEAAIKIGITRQYLNAVINGKLPLTTELQWKLQPVLKKGLEFWDDVGRQYDSYLTTAEGRRNHIMAREADLAVQWDLHGSRTLVNFEIETAVSNGVISVDIVRDDSASSAFDNRRMRMATYTLSVGPQAVVFDRQGSRRIASTLPYLELGVGERAKLATLETLRLGGRIMGHVEGLAAPLSSEWLELRGDKVIEPWNDSPLALGLKNDGFSPVRVSQGQPYVDISFEYLASEPMRPQPPKDET